MRTSFLATLTALCLTLAGAVLVPVGTTAAATASSGAVKVPVPTQARAVTGKTTRYVGNGTAASCTSKAVVQAVAKGGLIRFRCGSVPVTIHMTATAKVVNTSHRVVLDGGNKVTLDAGGRHRILYMDTCDQKQIWTTSHCDNQATPRLVVQQITFAHGFNGQDMTSADVGGGGAIFARGGRLKIVDSTFLGNHCRTTGPDVGGGAVRAFSQYENKPIYVVGSTFRGGRCSNGAALSSIGVSWAVYNSVFTNNHAVGHGANPARSGTPGGGSGGAIYLDGNRFTLLLAGTTITDNVANEGGGAVFFVSNDRTGTMAVRHSTLTSNPSKGFENYPGIYFLGRGNPTFTASVVR